jgi:non-heme chloroperoxidase
MPYFKAQDGTEIYYYDWGSGAPVVLIHGWPLTSASWEYQASALAASGFRVIAYDRRGFGRSGWPFAGYDYDTLVSDLHVLLETLDLKNAALVGFSMGGGEVARYVARYGSGRVAKAVFLGAVTPFLLKTDSNPGGVDQHVFDGMVEGLKKDRPAFLEKFWPSFYGRTMVKHTVSEPFLAFTQSMAMTASPKATVDLVRAWSETDFRKDLAGITIPALVIHGTGDATVPIGISGRPTAGLLPNAELLEYEGEPHAFPATVPDRLNEDLISFLRG